MPGVTGMLVIDLDSCGGRCDSLRCCIVGLLRRRCAEEGVPDILLQLNLFLNRCCKHRVLSEDVNPIAECYVPRNAERIGYINNRYFLLRQFRVPGDVIELFLD
jgi:hypothetical protein